MGKANKKGKKCSYKYKPFYPSTLGPILHDVTFQKLPQYSLRFKPDPIDKRCSPGPATYPRDHTLTGKKKHRQITKTIYPTDKAHKYSMGLKGKDFTIPRTPGPAAYPFTDGIDGSPLQILPSIYPKDKGNIFSMRKKNDEKNFTVSPGPAVYPRDALRENIINSIHPRDLANQFSMTPRRGEKLKLQSPGPAVYPNNKEKDSGDKNKIATIYPPETQLPTTMKGIYNIKNREKRPSPNSYPVIDGKHDPKKFEIDFMQKMRMGKRAPVYSLGLRNEMQLLHSCGGLNCTKSFTRPNIAHIRRLTLICQCTTGAPVTDSIGPIKKEATKNLKHFGKTIFQFSGVFLSYIGTLTLNVL